MNLISGTIPSTLLRWWDGDLFNWFKKKETPLFTGNEYSTAAVSGTCNIILRKVNIWP